MAQPEMHGEWTDPDMEIVNRTIWLQGCCWSQWKDTGQQSTSLCGLLWEMIEAAFCVLSDWDKSYPKQQFLGRPCELDQPGLGLDLFGQGQNSGLLGLQVKNRLS